MERRWICCQIGARDHYAVARALARDSLLDGLVTEAWVTPGNPLGWLRRKFRERYHVELKSARVFSWNISAIAFDLSARRRGLRGWDCILARNCWFQRQVNGVLSRWHESQPSTISAQTTLFCYSYAALEPFRIAKKRGWRTVLGQIDAGPEMGRIVQQLEQRHPEYQSRTDGPPEKYWESWRDECVLADRIVVNSEWSLRALEVEGISAKKIRVVPLAYSPTVDAVSFQRSYPETFSAQRPMRVLFLGQVTLAKGLVPLLEAADELRDKPVEFHIVGPLHVIVPEKWRRHPQIRWLGPVTRGLAAEHYRVADVFLFPTFSDGFGLTQLEAQAWQLPIVASRFCGDVVKDGVNGVQLPEVNATNIALTLRSLLDAPKKLSRMAGASGVGSQFSLAGIAAALDGVLD